MKYIEILDRIDKDSYFELNYKLTIDLPVNMQPMFNNETTYSKTGTLSYLPTDTVASIKAKLLDLWNHFNTETTTDKKWKFYGSYYDGTSWILSGIN